MKSILLYWSKGADARRRILLLMLRREESNSPSFTSEIARRLKLSHVAVINHLELLEGEGYVRRLNPGGKPAYIALTEKGKRVAQEFS